MQIFSVFQSHRIISRERTVSFLTSMMATLIPIVAVLSLVHSVRSFIPFHTKSICCKSKATGILSSKNNDENNDSPAREPFLAPWIEDAGAFAKAIFTNDNESDTSLEKDTEGELFDSDGNDEGVTDDETEEGSLTERVADFVRGNHKDKDDETLLEPYTDGLATEVEEVITFSNTSHVEKPDGKKAEGDRNVVQGGPSSLLGNVLGDDETVVSESSKDEETTDVDEGSPEIDEETDMVVSGSDEKKDETSPTKRIGKRMAQVVTGQDANDKEENVKTTSSSDGLLSLARDFKDLLLGGSESVMDSLMRHARTSTSRGGYEDDERSYEDLLRVVNEHRESIGATLQETFSPVDFSKLLPTSLFYYLELEDGRKNPSFKRMMHRFHTPVELSKVEELNEQLFLAKQSYCNTVQEVREGLKSAQEPVELVFCDTESFPGRPAHYIAVKKNQPQDDEYLEALMVVRGTKSITDIITDGLLVPEDYRGGKVHAGFLQSGRYLCETHVDLLRKLRTLANKQKVKLTLIGHSLGGGACAVAAMEFNERVDDIEAQVIGFGSPSLLSKELAESTEDFITTVIADNDIVPRLNDITLANTVLDVMEHDWTPLARRDIKHAFTELQRCKPGLLSDSTVDDIMALVDRGLERFAKPKIKEPTMERLEPVLYPPGTCIHFYRDGAGVSATYSPCTFFDRLDISRTCVRDHLMVGGYSRIFLRVMREYDNPHFVFENCLLE